MSVNKKYYWMKMFDTFFQDPRVKKLKKMPGGDTYIVIMLKLMLQTIKTNGLYEYEQLERNLAEELELKLDEDAKAIQVVLDYMAGYGMIVEIEKNRYQIPQVQKMIGSETAAAERKRNQRQREAQKLLKCDNVTPLSREVTKCHTEIEIEKELEIDKEIDISIEREEDPEITEMLKSFKSQAELNLFISEYVHSLQNVRDVNAMRYTIFQKVKKRDPATMENLLGFYQMAELEKIKRIKNDN